jgi:hypothetical protein
MRVTIESECRRGLKIIGEIPDIALCRLEGYNGIGKTSAVRLLELCTGGQPFAGNDTAWRTFCAELVHARVCVENLQGAQRLEWLLRPDDWHPEVRSSAGRLTSDMAQITIDGRKAALSDVEPLLQVHRLNVTEAPAKILAARAQGGHDTLDAWHSSDARVAAVDDLLLALTKLIESCSTDRVRLSAQISADSSLRAEAAVADALAARERVIALAAAAQAAERLEVFQGASPGHQQRLTELERQLEHSGVRKQELELESAQARANRPEDERAERAYTRAEKALKGRQQAQRKAAQQLKEAAAEAGVSPTRKRVAQEVDATERRLAQLVKAQPYVDAGPLLKALLQQLVSSLQTAIDSDLGGQVLVDADEGLPQWTVAGMHGACTRQLMRLAQAEQGSTGQQLSRDIQAARTRLDTLAHVAAMISDAEQAEDKLRKAEEALARAVSGLPGRSAGHLDDLVKQHNDCVQRGRYLQSEIDQLRSELLLISGGQSEEDLIGEVRRLCAEAGVDQARLNGALRDAREVSDRLNKQEAEATVSAASAVRDADRYRQEVDRVVAELGAAESLAWLRRAIPELADLPRLEMAEQLALLDQLVAWGNKARTKLDNTNRVVEKLAAELEVLATRLVPRPGSAAPRPLENGPTATWLVEEARRWFNDDAVRTAMFDGGQDVRLDLRDLSLSWTADGKAFERPLEAFSSGEQAFAYTRAQLLLLERSSSGQAANRLIALDEFGAFLDGRRIADLTDHLVERRRRVPDDQVVVILPSDLDPRDAKGVDTSRVRKLERLGYYAEPLRA